MKNIDEKINLEIVTLKDIMRIFKLSRATVYRNWHTWRDRGVSPLQISPNSEPRFLLSEILNMMRHPKCVLVAFIFSLMISDASAFTTEASYYTKTSCINEGTSGVYTASGEVFDENAYTCASWDYPFGTRLKISRNEKSVIAVVNDRGPSRRLYKRGRKIDLSKQAFRALAPLARGIITVTVTKL